MGDELSKYSVDDLVAEIERRNVESPRQLERIDITKLVELGHKYIDAMVRGDRFKDTYYRFYECALEALYGKDIWEALKTFPGEDDN